MPDGWLTNKNKNMVVKQNKRWPLFIFILMLALVYVGVFITIEFIGTPFSGIKGFITIMLQYIIVGFSAAAVVSLIASNKYVFALLFPVLIILSTVLAYYRLSMGVYLTPAIIELIFVNDLNIWSSVISRRLIMLLICSLVFSVLTVILRFKKVNDNGYIGILIALISIILICIPTVFVKRFYEPVTARMPYSFYYSFKEFINNRKDIEGVRDTFSNVAANCYNSAPDVIVIIGESTRADHLGINGYARQTTPHLAKEATLVSYPNVYTEPYYTHISVPHIVTRADKNAPDIKWEEQSFITLFKNAGYQTFWISNQDSSPAYIYFMNEADSLQIINPSFSLYNFNGKILDKAIVPVVRNNMMSSLGKPLLMVIHSIGSHWYYKSHYPDSLAVYKPEIDSRVLSELSQEQIVNSYDNTILALDDFVYCVINEIRNRNSIIIFISDHGESLGEGGRYLHGDDYPELHYPACFFWYSKAYEESNDEKIKCLKANRHASYTTDMVFHSVLDAAGISTAPLDTLQSVFRDNGRNDSIGLNKISNFP